MKCRYFLFIGISFFVSVTFGQLKLEEIMKGKDYIGHWPEDHQEQ